MAKNLSLIKINGNLDGLSFYTMKGKNYVRTVSKKAKTFNKKQIDHNKEFKAATAIASSIYSSVHPFLNGITKSEGYLIIFRKIMQMRKLDLRSKRGERSSIVALKTPDGVNEIIGLDFNPKTDLKKVLKANFVLDKVNNTLVIDAFNPKTKLDSPKNSAFYTLEMAVVLIDLEKNISEIRFSNVYEGSVNAENENINLSIEKLPNSKGFKLFLLKVLFYDELNGEKYINESEEANACAIIDAEFV